jgi:prepilin-type N-terminal cleavage/methylation domain-containing protein
MLRSKFQKGFTMIELLIVIAVLGVLATAVLSAINPIEQINRGRDTGTRSDAEQLLSAIDRYYTSKGYYPWQTGATDNDDLGVPWTQVEDTNWQDDDAQAVLDKISTGGTAELKVAFINKISAEGHNTLYIYNANAVGSENNSTYVCFSPQSGSFREDAWKRCNNHEDFGTLPTDFADEACPAEYCVGAATADAATGCFVCLP